MSNTNKTTAPKADVPKKADYSDGNQDKHSKHQALPTAARDKATVKKFGAHEPAKDAHSGSGCCGGGKTGK